MTQPSSAFGDAPRRSAAFDAARCLSKSKSHLLLALRAPVADAAQVVERALEAALQEGLQAAHQVLALVLVLLPGVLEEALVHEEAAVVVHHPVEQLGAVHRVGLHDRGDEVVLLEVEHLDLVEKSPENYRQWAGLRIEALNHALEGIPEDRIRYHVCFGSWHVPHLADAPLEEIVGFILSVRAGAYSIEAANPRHEHEWRVWESRKLPEGKILIPGVVTHHTMTVEHPRLVADRILRFANLVGRENVIAGTDCGFAQTEMVQRVPPSVMWAKFEALVEGARLASAELWPKRTGVAS